MSDASQLDRIEAKLDALLVQVARPPIDTPEPTIAERIEDTAELVETIRTWLGQYLGIIPRSSRSD